MKCTRPISTVLRSHAEECGTRSKWTRIGNDEQHSSYVNVTNSGSNSSRPQLLYATNAEKHIRATKKTCALPILAHMSHITISFASILFSYFYLSYTLQSTTHIRRQMLRFSVSLNVVGKIIEPILGFQLYIHVSHSTFTVLYNITLLLSIVWTQGWPKKMAGWLAACFVKCV